MAKRYVYKSKKNNSTRVYPQPNPRLERDSRFERIEPKKDEPKKQTSGSSS